MQLYVDETMNKFYQRFSYEFKQQNNTVKDLINNGKKLDMEELEPIFAKFDQIEADLNTLSLKVHVTKEQGNLKAVEDLLNLNLHQNK